MSRWTVFACTVIALTGVWHLTTLRPGHDWGDDFALYLAHTRNLAEGLPYSQTGYIYNPEVASLSPRTYPPVFPLLAVPIYQMFGLELDYYKVLLLVLFLLSLAIIYLDCQCRLPPAPCVTILLLLGMHPYFWQQKDRILSEIPFLLFTSLALLLLDRLRESEGSIWRRSGWAVLAGVVVYLAGATRTIGVVLLPCVLLQEMLAETRGWAAFDPRTWRWPGVTSGLVLGVAALGVLVQKTFLVVEGSYLDQLVFDPILYLENAKDAVRSLSYFLSNGYTPLLRLGLFILVSTLALIGYLQCISRGPTAREFFVPGYMAAVILWPSFAGGLRFLAPLLPLGLVYAGHGYVVLRQRFPGAVLRPAAVAVLAAVLLSYVGQYSRLSFGPLQDGVNHPATCELFDYVRQQTPTDAVFLFQKPRVLALFTQRKASAHKVPVDDQELWSYLETIGATHVVVGRPFPRSHAVLQSFVQRQSDRLEAVFYNDAFTVYRVRHSEQANRPTRTSSSAPAVIR